MRVLDYQLGLIKNCLYCSAKLVRKSGESSSNWRNRIYCSYDCNYRHKRKDLNFNCEECLSAFTTRANNKLRRFCSLNCMFVWRSKEVRAGRISMKNHRSFSRGKDNPNWKGGVSPLNEALRRTEEYKKWRKAVYKRDNYTCVECGKKGGDLHAHHIKEFSLYPELRHELDNGQTLCPACHSKTFKFYRNQYVEV